MRTIITKIIKLFLLCYQDAKSEIRWDNHIAEVEREKRAEGEKCEIEKRLEQIRKEYRIEEPTHKDIEDFLEYKFKGKEK